MAVHKNYPKNYIKEIRELRKLSLREVADSVGVAHQTISNLELSKADLTWSMVVKLANALHCDPLDITMGQCFKINTALKDLLPDQSILPSTREKTSPYPKSNHIFNKAVWSESQQAVADFILSLPKSIQKRITRESLMILTSWAYEDAYEQHEKGRDMYISAASLQSYLEKALNG
jgi:transcriptional regulator with XRE-family HTH domain